MYECQRLLQRSRAPSENDQNMSSSIDSRKSNKPLLEKKRRARINRSLEQLKALLIDTIKNDHATGYSKLEKADILELAVKYLRNVRSQQLTGVSIIDPKMVTARYQAGFSECASEVDRYLASIDNLGPDARARLMNHLAGCIAHRQLPPTNAAVQQPGYAPTTLVTSSSLHHQSFSSRSFEHYDVSMTSSSAQSSYASTSFATAASAAAAAATARCGVSLTTPFHRLTSPTFQSGSPECWTPLLGDMNETTRVSMDGCGFNSLEDHVDDSSRMNLRDVDGENDNDEDDEQEEVTSSTWNSRVARRDGRLIRPLAEKNDNIDNIARNSIQLQSTFREHHDGNHSFLHVKMIDDQLLLNDEVKDEPVWRPW